MFSVPALHAQIVIVGRWLTAFVAALATFGGPMAEAEATNVRIRSITVGRATQYLRSDQSVDAPRIFTQGLSLWAYDLTDDKSGAVNLHVALRYTTDFSLERRLRENPYFADQWNELTLDLAYVDWRPLDALRIRLGRQWSVGALGPRDFDGLQLRFRPRLDAHVRGRVQLYGGRDVQTAFGEFDPAQFDVQGLPADPSVSPGAVDGVHLVAGAAAGLSFDRDASVELSWRRRWTVGADIAVGGNHVGGNHVGGNHVAGNHVAGNQVADKHTLLGSQRVGAAASASVHPRLVVSGYGSYNTLLGDIDRAGADLAWRLPPGWGHLSGGIEHRRPWFDSSSIFNLFGTQPYEGGFAVYQRRVDRLDTRFEGRIWARQYHGAPSAVGAPIPPANHAPANHAAPNHTPASIDPADDRSVGAALSHRSRLHLGRTPVRWRSVLSYQQSLDRGTDQLLADSRVRLPVVRRDLFVSARALVLAASTDHRRLDNDGWAATGVVGLDLPILDVGTLSAAVETTGGSFYPTNTSVYASFALEYWP